MVTYAPPGYLLFLRDKTLVAQPFDAKGLKTTGEPVPLAEQVGTDSVGLARFSVSRDGVLAYRTGESGGRLVWRDRAGRELESVGDAGEYGNPALSPAGDRLAFDMTDPRAVKNDIWVRDVARGVNSRFTFGGGNNICPQWSPDGRTIVFSSDRNGTYDLFEKPAGGQGEEKLLMKSGEFKFASSWSRDGRYLAYSSQSAKTNWDIWVLPTFGDRKPIPFLVGPFVEVGPVFSPDARLLAYTSRESGRAEVYVQTFPASGGKWQVSTAGGNDPSWRADGKELYYRALDQKLMRVEIGGGDSFQAGIPQALFAGRILVGNSRNKYLPSADGQRFLYVSPLGRESLTPTTVVLNWFAALER
jgi:Tol biopolymer transport system component